MENTGTKKSAENSGEQEAPELHEFVVEFRKYKTELTKKYKERKSWIPPDESKILSFIPGTITKIYVSEGDYIDEGQELLILEAMKMKNTLYANHKGRIEKINVSEGERVPKSKVIIEMNLD